MTKLKDIFHVLNVFFCALFPSCTSVFNILNFVYAILCCRLDIMKSSLTIKIKWISSCNRKSFSLRTIMDVMLNASNSALNSLQTISTLLNWCELISSEGKRERQNKTVFERIRILCRLNCICVNVAFFSHFYGETTYRLN